jgi:hypothetical protein
VELANGWCSRCEVVVDFERPNCGEDDDNCPELVCLLCGTAYFGSDFYVAAISMTPTNAVVTPAA